MSLSTAENREDITIYPSRGSGLWREGYNKGRWRAMYRSQVVRFDSWEIALYYALTTNPGIWIRRKSEVDRGRPDPMKDTPKNVPKGRIILEGVSI
jgi:hypothetical protein